jgi:hypothetical protein
VSLLNAWVTPAEAIVAVDTDGVGQDGARMPSSKLLPIPHLNAVMALRGQSAFLAFLFLRCISSSFETFDEMNDAMPGVLADVDAYLPADKIVSSCRIGNELVLAGWSARRGRMLGRRFLKRDDMDEFSAADTELHVAPWHASLEGTPTKAHAVEKLARAQVRWMREMFPNAACGGKLLVCRLTRKSLTLSHQATFQPQGVAA